MDIYCRHCAEPFDPNEFHYGDKSQGTYKQWIAAFRKYGCGAVNAFFDGESVDSVERCDAKPLVNNAVLDQIGIVTDLSEYADDIAVDSEMIDFDAEY